MARAGSSYHYARLKGRNTIRGRIVFANASPEGANAMNREGETIKRPRSRTHSEKKIPLKA